MTYTNLIHDLGAQAKKSAFILAQTDTPAINGALRTLAEKLRDNHNTILEANQKDVDAARAKELSSP